MKEGREINYTIRLGLPSKRRAEPEQADEEDGEEGTKTEDFDTYEKTEDFDTFETEKIPLKEERKEDKEQTMSSRSDSEIAKGPPKENKIEIDAQEMEKNPPKEEKKPLKKRTESHDNRSDSEIAIDPPKEYSKDLKNLRSLWKELKKEIGTVEATWSSFKKKIDKIIVSRIYHHWKQGDTVDTGNKEQRTKGGQGTKGAHGTKGATKKLSHHIDQI